MIERKYISTVEDFAHAGLTHARMHTGLALHYQLYHLMIAHFFSMRQINFDLVRFFHGCYLMTWLEKKQVKYSLNLSTADLLVSHYKCNYSEMKSRLRVHWIVAKLVTLKMLKHDGALCFDSRSDFCVCSYTAINSFPFISYHAVLLSLLVVH